MLLYSLVKSDFYELNLINNILDFIRYLFVLVSSDEMKYVPICITKRSYYHISHRNQFTENKYI